MVAVKAHIVKEFRTTASPEACIKALSDIQNLSRHMPKVQKIEPDAGGFKWTMEKVGAGPISTQVIYASDYKTDGNKVSWTSRSGYNSSAEGFWEVTPDGEGSKVKIDSGFETEIPVPRMLKGAAESFVAGQYDNTLNEYTANIKKTLDGGDGTLR